MPTRGGRGFVCNVCARGSGIARTGGLFICVFSLFVLFFVFLWNIAPSSFVDLGDEKEGERREAGALYAAQTIPLSVFLPFNFSFFLSARGFFV